MTRMWMIDPRILCKSHLLGEHYEIHKAAGGMAKGHDITGWIRNNCLEPSSMQARHDELVLEMERRAYNHFSPFIQPKSVPFPEFRVDRKSSLQDLISRCPECQTRYKSLCAIDASFTGLLSS